MTHDGSRGGRITRRHMLAGLSSAVLLPALAATRSFAADDDLRFVHAYGETVLPRPATRVVSLGYTTHDTLLALEVPPVAVRYWFGDQPFGIWPWAQPYLKGAQPTVIKGEVAMETIAALQPDLIVGIGSGISKDEYAVLSQIAPVLMHASDRSVYGTPWDELVRTLGRAVGKSDLAQSLIAKVQSDFSDMRARHPDWAGHTAVAASNFGGETGGFAATDTRGRLLTELGFQIPAAVQRLAGDSFYAKLSPEDLSPLDADVLIWIASSGSAADLVAMPMRKMLRAHREGREIFADPMVAAAMSFGSVLSLPFALGKLEPEIVAAIDGRPETPVPSAVQAGLAP